MGNNPNQILPFATGAAANVLSPQSYATLTALQQGFQAGICPSSQMNTVLRQASFVAAMVAQFTADYGPASVNDDGNLANFETNFVAALHQMFIGIPDVNDVGAANAIVINPPTPATSYAVPMSFFIKVFAANALIGANGATTINVSGLGPKALKSIGGGQLNAGDLVAGGKILVTYDGVQFQLLSNTNNSPIPGQVIHYGRDISTTPSSVIAAVDVTVAAYSQPTWFAIYIGNNNTGPATLNINGIGTIPITRGAGTPLSIGDLVDGTIAFMCYDGAEAQLINPQTWGEASSGAPADWNDITGQLRPYWLAVTSNGFVTPPVSPNAGDTYLLPASGLTGAWSGQNNKLAQWTGSAWVYKNYPEGSLIGASDTNRFYNWNGTAWREVLIKTLGTHMFLAGAFA